MNELTIYHGITEDAIGLRLAAYLSNPGSETWNLLVRLLWESETSIQGFLVDRILYAENPFTRAAEAGRVSPELRAVAAADLQILGTMFHARTEAFPPQPAYVAPSGTIDARLAAVTDWSTMVNEVAEHIQSHGAGEMGRHRAFRWENGELCAVVDPDPVRLENLVGNTDATEVVVRNTEQFLKGLPANNLLLYGDRGTGKSSTVKALIHRFGDEGLRLVEVSRDDLGSIGQAMRALRNRPQRFILVVDDLSFEDSEVSYKTFKAMLEGSLERRPTNVLVYATSNRKHLVRERWRDRQAAADEVHPGDSMQELTSLADRFGVTVVFMSPDQEQYLAIVDALATQQGVTVPREELHRMALQWVLWHNARNGRTARQFIDDLCGRLGIQ